MILKFRYESVRIVIFQTCAFEELRIQILSADYQFSVILDLNNFGPGYMIRLSRDELIGGIILIYGNKSPILNKSSRHHERN